VAVFFLAFLACSWLSTLLSPPGTVYVPFWLPAGLYVAVLLLNEVRTWPWFAGGALAANLAFDLTHGTGLGTTCLFYLANTLQAVVGAALVVWTRRTLESLPGFFAAVGLAGVLGPAVGALVGAATLVVQGFSTSFAESFLVWWGSNAMAVLVLTPAIVSWGRPRPRPGWPPVRVLEAVVLWASFIAVTWHVMSVGGALSPIRNRPVVFLLWAGMRFGVRGAAAANLVLGLLATFLTAHLSPMASVPWPFDYTFNIQMLLAMATLIAMVPALAVEERDDTLARLQASEERFSKAFHSSPNPMVITELDSGRYIEVNDSFCKLFGYHVDEMLGKSAVELGIMETPEVRQDFIRPVYEAGRLRDLEMLTRHRNGTPKILLVSADVVEIEGRQRLISVLSDITERRQAEERLDASHLQLRALTTRLETLREEERTRLAREIHDHLGQLLTALKLDLRSIERRVVPIEDPATRDGLMAKLTEARDMVDETITSVQKIASELRPAVLDRLGLEAAVEAEMKAFETRSGLTVRCTVEAVGAGPEQSTVVYRILQEILTNIVRHAQATHVRADLRPHDNHIILQVEDDGVGMHLSDTLKPTSLGLLGMQERAQSLGGTVAFGPPGTTVTLQLPLTS
jgi:PAS domain S-box-containing protein